MAGFWGLYGASYLNVASPDLIMGELLHSITELKGIIYIFSLIVSIAFSVAILSAVTSTIDSLLISITGIFKENMTSKIDNFKALDGKYLMLGIIFIAFVFSLDPPDLIIDLAKIQVGGLMALVPCLLAPTFGITNSKIGWVSILSGLFPLILSKIFNINFSGFDVGLICLISALTGLLIAILFTNKEKR